MALLQQELCAALPLVPAILPKHVVETRRCVPMMLSSLPHSHAAWQLVLAIFRRIVGVHLRRVPMMLWPQRVWNAGQRRRSVEQPATLQRCATVLPKPAQRISASLLIPAAAKVLLPQIPIAVVGQVQHLLFRRPANRRTTVIESRPSLLPPIRGAIGDKLSLLPLRPVIPIATVSRTPLPVSPQVFLLMPRVVLSVAQFYSHPWRGIFLRRPLGVPLPVLPCP